MVALICISNHLTRKRFLLQVSTWNKCSYCIVNTRGWCLAWFVVIQRAKHKQNTAEWGDSPPRSPRCCLQVTFHICVLQLFTLLPQISDRRGKDSSDNNQGGSIVLGFPYPPFPCGLWSLRVKQDSKTEAIGWSKALRSAREVGGPCSAPAEWVPCSCRVLFPLLVLGVAARGALQHGCTS